MKYFYLPVCAFASGCITALQYVRRLVQKKSKSTFPGSTSVARATWLSQSIATEECLLKVFDSYVQCIKHRHIFFIFPISKLSSLLVFQFICFSCKALLLLTSEKCYQNIRSANLYPFGNRNAVTLLQNN